MCSRADNDSWWFLRAALVRQSDAEVAEEYGTVLDHYGGATHSLSLRDGWEKEVETVMAVESDLVLSVFAGC